MVKKTVQGPQDPIKFISITGNNEVSATTSDLLNQRIREEEQRQGIPIEDILVGPKRTQEEDPNKLNPAKEVREEAKEKQSNVERLGKQALINFEKRLVEETFSLEKFFGPESEKSDADIVKNNNSETNDLMRMAAILSENKKNEVSAERIQYGVFNNIAKVPQDADAIRNTSSTEDDIKKSLGSIDKNISELLTVTKTEKREDETEDEFLQREIDRLRKKEEEFAAREGKEKQVIQLATRAEELEKSDEATADKFRISNLDRIGSEFDKNFARRLNEDAPFLNLLTPKLKEAQDVGSNLGGLDILGMGGLKNATIPKSISGIKIPGLGKTPAFNIPASMGGGARLLPTLAKGGLAGAAIGGASYLASEYIDTQKEEVIPGVENEDLKLGVDIGGSALTGAAMGAAFGPLGALAGGAAGLGYGLYQNWNKIGEEWKEGEDKIDKGWESWLPWSSEDKEDTTQKMAKEDTTQKMANDKVSKTTTELKRKTDSLTELKSVTRDSSGTTTNITTINNSTSAKARTVVLTETAGDAKSLNLNRMGY